MSASPPLTPTRRASATQSLIAKGRQASATGRRLPAGDLERVVETRIVSFLKNSAEVLRALEAFTPEVNERHVVAQHASALGGSWLTLAPSARRALLQQLVARITLTTEKIDITVRPQVVRAIANADPAAVSAIRTAHDEPLVVLAVPARLKRAGMEMRLVVESPSEGRREPDRSMLHLIVRAQRFRAMILASEEKTIAALAREAGVSASYFTRILKLSFLAPDALNTIVAGRHPIELTAKRLSLHTDLPNAWPDQLALLRLG